MTTTDVDICNRALQLVGSRNKVGALTGDSEEAQSLNMIYSPMLDWCLGVTNWNFARKAAVLMLLKNTPTTPFTGPWTNVYPSPPWGYEYQYPSDAIRIQYVISQAMRSNKWIGSPAKFVTGMDDATSATRVILTDQADAIALYTARITNPDLWSPLFQQAFICMLAFLICPAFTHDKELMKELYTMFDFNMTLAVQVNTNEGLVLEDTTPEWISARGVPTPARRQPPSAMLLPGRPEEPKNGR